MLTVASLFTGCGGSSLGYRQAGLDVVYACELNELAAETYELNGGLAVDRRDVRLLRGRDIGRVDVLDASPPCQGLSMAGKRDPDDPRSKLYFEAVRLVGEVRPRAFVIENVHGLLAEPMRGLYFEPALRLLRGHGYRVGVQVLDASWLGVPQARQRVIVIGFREDLRLEPARARLRRAARGQAAIRDALPDVVRLLGWDDTWLATGPAPTITTGGVGWPRAVVPLVELRDGEQRPMNVDELKALCGFPAEFSFPPVATEADKWKMLGNAVVPGMARSWASGLRDLLAPRPSAGRRARRKIPCS
jgi:DNA (cytosine-5)-methyltransferase 1